MAQEQFNGKVKPGDLIEVDRGFYQHWAVYIGGNEVVHLVTPNKGSEVSELRSVLNTSTAEVRCDKLQEVVGLDHFSIRNLLDDKYEPREPHVIVRDARAMVGRYLRYNAVAHNCEHFVTELRYGKPESRQVRNTVSAIGGVALGVTALAVLGAILFSGFSEKEEEEEEERVNRTRQRNSRGRGNRHRHDYY